MTQTTKTGAKNSRASILLAGLWLASCASATHAPKEVAAPRQSAALEVAPPLAESVSVDVAGQSLALPRGLTSFGSAAVDGQLYVLGGYFGSPHAYSKDEQSAELLRLDVASGAWQRVATTDPVQGVALVAHEGQLIRIGGMQASNDLGTPAKLRSVGTVEAFDPATSRWSTLPALPAPRSSHDAVVLGDTLWVIGGWSIQGEQKVWQESVLRLDLADPSSGWVQTGVPFRRRALAAATAQGKIVALGGITEAGTLSSAVDVYDVGSDSWSSGPAFPGRGFGMAAASLGEAVYASGMEGIVYRWSPGEPDWTRVSTLAYPRFFHRIVPSSSEELLVIGGIRGMGSGTRIRPIERISTGKAQAQATVLAYEIASPLPSKNRQGMALVGDTLLIFGGNTSLEQHDFEPEFFTDVGYGLNLASLKWRKIAPYPVKRQSMSTFTTADNGVVSIAGFGHDGAVARSHPEIFSYDLEADKWRPAGTLPGHGRTQFGLAVRDEKLVVFGGLDFDPTRPEADRFRHELPLLEAQAGEPDLRFEDSDLKLREPRRAFAGALIDDTYYLVGGMRDGFALVDTCEALDLSQAKWTTIACPERGRISAQMVSLQGKLYLAAGSSKGERGTFAPNRSLEVYDPKTDTWTSLLRELPIQTTNVRMFPYGADHLVLISTQNDNGDAHVVMVSLLGE